LAGSLFPHTEFPLKQKEDDMFRAIPRGILPALAAALLVTASAAYAQQKDFKPHVGQQGKDVVWVPTPDEVVERMLNMAQTKPEDYVIDLGAGDGKIAIAAAKKFGARSLGVEYNPDMVAHAQRNARAAGVLGKTQIVQGDIFVTDFTQATVLTLYLLPSLNMKLRPQILAMRPGTRVVAHAFNMEDWEPDETSDVDGRRVYLWIVPASVAGRWAVEFSGAGGSEKLSLNVDQKFQKIEGVAYLGSTLAGLRDPRLSGFRIGFAYVDNHGVRRDFTGRVTGSTMEGSFRTDSGAEGRWTATKK
jgi:SAM-dependent methyltransferase